MVLTSTEVQQPGGAERESWLVPSSLCVFREGPGVLTLILVCTLPRCVQVTVC